MKGNSIFNHFSDKLFNFFINFLEIHKNIMLYFKVILLLLQLICLHLLTYNDKMINPFIIV